MMVPRWRLLRPGSGVERDEIAACNVNAHWRRRCYVIIPVGSREKVVMFEMVQVVMFLSTLLEVIELPQGRKKTLLGVAL
jgi:hypothetical protein